MIKKKLEKKNPTLAYISSLLKDFVRATDYMVRSVTIYKLYTCILRTLLRRGALYSIMEYIV